MTLLPAGVNRLHRPTCARASTALPCWSKACCGRIPFLARLAQT
jgi:hypothetical protein